MTARINNTEGKLLCGGAAVILILSCVWVGRGQAGLRHLRHRSVALAVTGSAYQPEKWPQPEAQVRDWPSPVAQASGTGWCYEVFTPPVIYANAPATGFTVGQPTQNGADPALLDGELLAVKPEPYRLQLMGYVGLPGQYRALFVRPGQPGTLLIREGHCMADLGLILRSIKVDNISRLPGGSAQVRATQAILHDARSGEDVVLDSRTTRHTGALLAVLRAAGERRSRERREGDDWTLGTVTYRVERIQLDPPEVVLTRPGVDPSRPARMVIHPASGVHHLGQPSANSSAVTTISTAAGLASARD